MGRGCLGLARWLGHLLTMWPGFDSGTNVISELSFFHYLLCSARLLPEYSGFSLSPKEIIPFNSNLDKKKKWKTDADEGPVLSLVR